MPLGSVKFTEALLMIALPSEESRLSGCDGRSLHFDVSLPDRGSSSERDHQVAGAGNFRLPSHLHARFVWCAPPLSVVALGTGTGRIRPGVLAPSRPRHDVIDGEVIFGEYLIGLQVTRLHATVNASVLIADEHRTAAPGRPTTRHIDIGAQRDHRRHGEPFLYGTEELTAFFNDHGFTGQQEVHRARHGNNGERFPGAAVEQQDPLIDDRNAVGHGRLSSLQTTADLADVKQTASEKYTPFLLRTLTISRYSDDKNRYLCQIVQSSGPLIGNSQVYFADNRPIWRG